MKSLSLLALSLLLFAVPSRADETETVQSQVRGFYQWYVHGLNTSPGAEPRKTAAIHRYISERYLKEIARKAGSSYGLESDPFICGQDWDPGWEKNIRIKDMDHTGTKWTVQVELSGREMAAHRLNLVLIHEGKTWKIDKITDGDTH